MSTKEIARTKDALMQEIVDHMAEGGTVVSFCKQNNLPYNDIQRYISSDPGRAKQLLAAVTARAEWAVERVTHELGLMAFADIREAFNPDGSMKSPSEMPEHISRAIEAIEVDELFEGTGRERKQIGWTKRIKFAGKLKALELFGKQFGMFKDKVEVSGNLTLEDLITKSKESK